MALVELGLIGVWALWVGRLFLNLDPTQWPPGREFGSQILSLHLWPQLLRCGVCALWNGSFNGGAPALADAFGSTLHPLVIIPTLIWGTVNGAKLAIVGGLWTAGAAQWSIARTLRLGRVARLWSALLVVVGGHLLGRLELGAIGLIVSTAAASLALAAALNLGLKPSRRNAILLALASALAIVSGQGYLQVALLGWGPAFLFLLLDEGLRPRSVWREYAIAVGLALLLAGVFLIPVLHFWPQFTKPADAAFGSAQPLEFTPLNLIVNDPAYLRGEVLDKLPYPYLYNIFIGWVPVLLAALCLRVARQEHHAPLLTLAAGAFTMFLMASALPFRWLVDWAPSLAGFRHTPLIASLAVPAILGLAAYGLDWLLHAQWPQVGLRFGSSTTGRTVSFSLAWILTVPLVASLKSGYDFGKPALLTVNNRPVYEIVGSLQTPGLQWVATPFGEHYWVEPAIHAGLKVQDVIWAWEWKGRPAPPPRLIAARGDAPPGTLPAGDLGGIPIFEDPSIEYAAVELDGGASPCRAEGGGGIVQVMCDTAAPGDLVVRENAWSGWMAWLDGERVPLIADRWLRVAAPAGEHTTTFRYLPWDVPLGLLLTLAGTALSAWLWVRAPRAKRGM